VYFTVKLLIIVFILNKS